MFPESSATTTPSPEPEIGHRWVSVADYGGGPVPVCARCGVRNNDPAAHQRCDPRKGRAPTKVLSEYDPLERA